MLHSSRNYYSINLSDLIYKYYFKKKNNFVLILRNTAKSYLTNLNYLNLNNFIFKEFPHYRKCSKKKNKYVISPFGLYFKKINNTKSYFFNYFEKKNSFYEVEKETNSNVHMLYRVIMDNDYSNFVPYKSPRFYTAYDYNMVRARNNLLFTKKLDLNKIFKNQKGFGERKQQDSELSVKNTASLFQNSTFYNLKNNMFNFIDYRYEYMVWFNNKTSYLIPFFLKTTTVATANKEYEVDDEDDEYPAMAPFYVLSYKHYYFKNNFINFIKKRNFKRHKNNILNYFNRLFSNKWPTKLVTTLPTVTNKFKFYNFSKKKIIPNSTLKRNVDNLITNNNYKILNLNKFNYYLNNFTTEPEPKKLKSRNQKNNWFLNSKLFFTKNLFVKKNKKLTKINKVNVKLSFKKVNELNKIIKVAKKLKNQFVYLPNQRSKFNSKFGTKLKRFSTSFDLFNNRPINIVKNNYHPKRQSNFWLLDVLKYEKLYKQNLKNYEYLYLFTHSPDQNYEDILLNNLDTVAEITPLDKSSFYTNYVGDFVNKLGYHRGYTVPKYAVGSRLKFKKRYRLHRKNIFKILNLNYKLVNRFLFEQNDYFNYFKTKISPLKIKKPKSTTTIKKNILTLNKFKKLLTFNFYLISKLNVNSFYSLIFISIFVSIFTTNNKVEDFFPTAFEISYVPKQPYGENFLRTLRYNRFVGFYFEELLHENYYLRSERISTYYNVITKFNNLKLVLYLVNKVNAVNISIFNFSKQLKLTYYNFLFFLTNSNNIKTKIQKLTEYNYNTYLVNKKFKQETKRLKKILKLNEEFEKSNEFNYYLFKK